MYTQADDILRFVFEWTHFKSRVFEKNKKKRFVIFDVLNKVLNKIKKHLHCPVPPPAVPLCPARGARPTERTTARLMCSAAVYRYQTEIGNETSWKVIKHIYFQNKEQNKCANQKSVSEHVLMLRTGPWKLLGSCKTKETERQNTKRHLVERWTSNRS